MDTQGTIFPIDLAKEFPAVPSPLIPRDANLDMIDRLFEEHSLLFLEPGAGMGTTSTAAQYCRRHCDSTFALFIKPASRVAYSVDYLRLVLAEQFHFYLNGSAFSGDIVAPSDFNRYRLQLRRKASKKKPLYLVVDGLHQIPKGDIKAVEEILQELLPFGWDGFKFLIVGHQVEFQKLIPVLQGKPAYALAFTPGETSRFLAELALSDGDLQTVHQLCQGNPGRLATVRRMLSGGATLNQILDVNPEAGPEFVRLEFQPVAHLSPRQREVVAIFAHSGRQLTVNEACAILGVSESDVDSLVQMCTFFEKKGTVVEFVSEAHRQYAARLLESEKRVVLEAQVAYLLQNPTSSIAVNFLPTYYQQLEKTLELIRLLNADHFTHLLDETASLGSLKARVTLGLKSAISAQMSNEVFGFSLKGNLVSSIAAAKGRPAEVRALVALGNPGAALDLADHSLIREERLAFLATYAKECRASGIVLSPEVLERIKEESAQLDFAHIGDAAVLIATDLLSVDQALAMSIVEKVRDPSTGSGHATRLSSALPSAVGNESGSSNSLREGGRVSDETFFFYTETLSELMRDIPASRVKKISEAVNEFNRLEFLSAWLLKNATTANAIDVAEYALDLMIGLTAYTPKMSDLSAFASPLPHLKDVNHCRALVERFDSQRTLIRDTSISEKSVELQLKLAHGECLYDKTAAGERVIDVYYDIQGIAESDIRIDCLAKMLTGIAQLGCVDQIPSIAHIEEMCAEELGSLVDEMLSSTADHFVIVKNALKSLTTSDVDLAFCVAKKLNTVSRRDEAFSLIARELLRSVNKDGLSVINNLATAYGSVEDPLFRAAVVEQGLKSICLRKIKISESEAITLKDLISLSPTPDFINASAAWLCAIVAQSELPNLLDPLLIEIDRTLSLSIADAQKISTCFRMATALNVIAPDKANNYFLRAREYQNQIAVARTDHAQALAYCCGLATRALAWLSLSSTLDEPTLGRFVRLASMIPSLETQIEIMADLACRLYLKGSGDLARRVATQYCYSMLAEEMARDKPNVFRIIGLAFPAMYLAHNQDLAIEQLRSLPQRSRGEAIDKTIDCVLYKRPWTDPTPNEGPQRNSITYADALSICRLIEEYVVDYDVYSSIRKLCQTIVHKTNSTNFTAQQLINIANRLEAAYKDKLPDPVNIKHDGYLVVCSAAVLLLKQKSTLADWKAIVVNALSVPNVSDRSYIMGELADLIPSRFTELQRSCREKWYELADNIPSVVDRIGRLLSVSESPNPDSVAQAKSALRAAILLTFQAVDQQLAMLKRREIIDAAAKIDEKFADELAEIVDEDPARENARKEVRDQLHLIRARKKLINAKSDSESLLPEEAEHISRAAWESLGRLMSSRIECKELNVMDAIVKQGAAMSLGDSYPLLAWYIENLGQKYHGAKNGDALIRSMVEKLLTTTELAISLIQKINNSSPTSSLFVTDAVSEGGVIGLNNRSSALRFLTEWLQSACGDITLCDPYFSPKDVEFLALALANAPNSNITILTSRSKLEDAGAANDEKFLESWRAIKDQDPPVTQIIAVSHADSIKTPLHDRWLLCERGGIRLGTSFNSIGTGKLSEISQLDNAEFQAVRDSLSPFVNQRSIVEDVRIRYLAFSL